MAGSVGAMTSASHLGASFAGHGPDAGLHRRSTACPTREKLTGQRQTASGQALRRPRHFGHLLDHMRSISDNIRAEIDCCVRCRRCRNSSCGTGRLHQYAVQRKSGT